MSNGFYSAIGYYLRHQEAVEAYLNDREQLAGSVRQRLLGIQPDLSVVRSRLLGQKKSCLLNPVCQVRGCEIIDIFESF